VHTVILLSLVFYYIYVAAFLERFKVLGIFNEVWLQQVPVDISTSFIPF
jgi:hypothetical protein